MDVRMQKEMSRSADMMALAMIIVGAIGISVFIALEVLSAVFEKFDYEVMFFILLFRRSFGSWHRRKSSYKKGNKKRYRSA